MTEPLIYEQNEGIVTLTINRPEERNALSDDLIFTAFIEAANRINLDNSVRCVILTGKGKAFSAHGLVKGTKERPQTTDNGAVQVDGLALEFNTDPVSLADFDSWNRLIKSGIII